MRKLVLVPAVALLLLTTGCYTSRRVAGDDLEGGVTNPYLWVTVPVDAVLSPIQVVRWANDEKDTWTPWDFDAVRREYNPDPPSVE